MLRFFYRCMQRVIVLERVCVLAARSQTVAARLEPANLAKQLSQALMGNFVVHNEAPHSNTLVDQMLDPNLHCVGVVQKECLLSFAWFYVGTARADTNYGKDSRTATALSLTPDSAFVFHAYTSVNARGKRLLTQVLSRAAEMLHHEQDIRYLVTTTEWTNSSARLAFQSAGFTEVGFYWRCGLGPWNFGIYPRPNGPVLGYETPRS